MKISSLEQANTILQAYIPEVMQSVNWSFLLEDMQDLLQELGSPQETLKVIHVAGTSGKTSTCYYIADMLRRAGKTVGLTVSPHVDTVNERVQLNGQPLSEQEFCQQLGVFLDLPAVKASKPSYFGLLAAFAYWFFVQKKVDYAVIEVGMGGRLDATNVVSRADKIAVITDIGLDHVQMLGGTIPAIATEKAGIIQQGNLVLVSNQADEALDVIRARAAQQHAQLAVINQSADAPEVLPLFQRRNWSLARAVVQTVAKRDGFALDTNIMAASAGVRVPGRMEVRQWRGKTLVCDGAHNAQKIAALTESMAHKYPGQRALVLLSFVQGKDTSLEDSMQSLRRIADAMIVTSFEIAQDMSRRSIDPEQVAAAARANGFTDVRIIKEPEAALQSLADSSRQLCLITGSLYLLNRLKSGIEATDD